MQLKEFNIMLDIKKHKKNEEIEIVQGDFDTNIINITLYDGLNVYSLDGLNIEIAFAKSDGTTVLQGSQDEMAPIAIAGNKIICTLKTNTIAAPGKVLAEVRILDNDRLLTSTRFEFYVRKAIVNDETIESTNEFPLLKKLTDDVEGVIATEESRQINEDIRVANETDRVQAEDERAAIFTGYEERVSTVETDLATHKEDYAKRTGFPAKNMVTNGDFSNGTMGWTTYAVGATVSAVDSTLIIKGNGSNPEPRTFTSTGLPIIDGHKYFIKVLMKVTNSSATSLNLIALGSTTGISRVIKTIVNPTINNEYCMSGIYSPANDIGVLRVGMSHKYSALASSNEAAECEYVIAIDLTETFGVGNEPSVEQVGIILSKFENNWFNGTVNLINFKDGYLELSNEIKKINSKVQDLQIPYIGYIDNPSQSEFLGQAMITLSYDDGFLNNYNLALPIHEKYGISGTFNIITSNINSNNKRFMSDDKVLDCCHRGMEIASHSHYHNAQLPTKTDEEIHFECSESKRILEGIIGVSKVETMAIPFSAYDERVKSIVKQYYKGIRVYGETLNSIPPADRYNLYSRIAVGNTTTFAQVKSVIDATISQKKWCIIMLHGINNGTKDTYEISQKLLDEILKYITMQGRNVLLPVTTKDGLKYSLGDAY